MNLSRVFILRPIATSLLMLAIVLAGSLAYRWLPIASLPQVDHPIIQVTTLYPGASPEVTTSAITAPLERQFGQMPGLDQMTSVSSGGASMITLRFALDLRLDVVEQQVQAAINAAGSLLPADLPMPPTYRKVNPADAPIITLAVSSPTLPITQVHDLVENRIVQRLAQVSGVGMVSIAGGPKAASMARRGLPPSTPTINCANRPTTPIWCWLIAMATPCDWAMWPMWQKPPKTPGWQPGPTGIRPS